MVACIGHFILFLPSLTDSSSDTWSCEILIRPRDSCALRKLQKPQQTQILKNYIAEQVPTLHKNKQI